MENGKNFPPDTIPRIEEEKRETGPPPEAPVPVPLTEAQRRFAAQYHALIYGFLLEKKLEIREYYDIAAIGYLHAVQRYLYEIYYRKLIIFLEVLKCRQSLMFQGFPAFLVTEDVLKSP